MLYSLLGLSTPVTPDRSSQTRQHPRIDGYGSGFGPPRSSVMGFQTGLEPIRTVFPVRTRTTGSLPGPVANSRETSISFFGVCGYNNLIKFNEGNFVFADVAIPQNTSLF